MYLPSLLFFHLSFFSVCSALETLEGVGSIPIVFYNPLAWPSTQTIRLPFTAPSSAPYVKVVNSEFQEIQSVLTDDGFVAFVVDVAPLGYNTYFIVTMTSSSQSNLKIAFLSIANHHLIIYYPVVVESEKEQKRAMISHDDVIVTNGLYQLRFDNQTNLLRQIEVIGKKYVHLKKKTLSKKFLRNFLFQSGSPPIEISQSYFWYNASSYIDSPYVPGSNPYMYHIKLAVRKKQQQILQLENTFFCLIWTFFFRFRPNSSIPFPINADGSPPSISVSSNALYTQVTQRKQKKK